MEQLSITNAVKRICEKTGVSEYLASKQMYMLEARGDITITPDITNKNRKLISEEDVEKIIAILSRKTT